MKKNNEYKKHWCTLTNAFMLFVNVIKQKE